MTTAALPNGDSLVMPGSPDSISENGTNGTLDPSAPQMVTLRMIMQGKEAGSIIGKKGDNVKKFREDSGAKINISDSSCPERIVTVTGTTDQIFKAFTMICKKFEEDIVNTHNSTTLPKPPVTLRLIVPASQCGSLIGKGGAKIKEIRELTGASIQVASEMLPNSTERAVTVSGQADAITQCIYNICCVMLESPPKGATIPYRPKPCVPPVILPASCGGQAFAMQAGQQILLPPSHPNATQPDPRSASMHGPPANFLQFHPSLQPQLTKIALQQGFAGHPAVPIVGAHQGLIPAGMNAALAAGIPTFAPRQAMPGANMSAQTHEMTIPNDLIGCIIGRGGAKINEIRQLSGATIKIANADEGSSDRKVTIMGSLETIHAAQYMINASVEMHKQLLAMNELSAAAAASMPAAPSSSASASPLQQQQQMMPMSAMSPMNHMMRPMALQVSNPSVHGQMFDAKSLTTKLRTSPNSVATATMLATAAKKNKFTPY